MDNSYSLAYLWWPAVKVMISKILEASSKKECRLGLVRTKMVNPSTSSTISQSRSLSSVEQCTRVSSMSSTSVYYGQHEFRFILVHFKLESYVFRKITKCKLLLKAHRKSASFPRRNLNSH